VIFGTGTFAEVAHFYFTHDSDYEVVGFTVDASHLDRKDLEGLPVVAFEEVADRFGPNETDMFVAIGYAGVNRLRAERYSRAKKLGYTLATYVSSRATTWPGLEVGDNCFVFEDNTLQPFTRIGDDVVMWSGNHIGHHSTIGDHCFITSHVVVSGNVTVGPYCFLGVNATIRDSIEIGEACVIGAAALIMRSTAAREVYVPEQTRPSERSSDEIRM
jgi:sugar O-acyltransferase (sialic acid O-acetyltransferase NeuD family)